MKKRFFKTLTARTWILLPAILSLLALANICFYLYRQNISPHPKAGVSRTGACEDIKDENQCFNDNTCEGIYDEVSGELKFLYCRTQSEQTQKDRQAQKDLCEKTGGEHYASKLGSFCLCQSAGLDKKFDKTKGCVPKAAE